MVRSGLGDGRGPRSAAARRFVYQPALDGVRAVAVAMVLCFHAGFGWMTGGYVGVSVFFTLSGFLITSLALVEHERHGRLDVGAFYARRIRRLLPAGLVAISAVVVAAWLGAFDGADHLRRDVWAALAQVYNWVALAADTSYADVVSPGGARLAPLDHYWSLAIEEQFYWVWPIALLGLLRLRPRGRIAAVGALALAGAVAAPVIARVWGPDAAYWATPARLGEILVGALTAVAVHERRATGRRLPAATSWLAPAGLAMILVAAVTWPADSGPAYAGWLPVFAGASAALIVGLQVDGPVRRLLARPPLVLLGTVSYGMYLYHWPVYAVLDEQRTGLGTGPLFLVRLAVTLALAGVSYRFVERPVRQARFTIRPVSVAALATGAVVALVATFVPIERPGYWAGSAEARQRVALEPADSIGALVPVTATEVAVASTAPPDATESPEVTASASSSPAVASAETAATPVAATEPEPATAPEPATSPPSSSPTTVPAPTTTEPPATVYGSGAVVPALPASVSRPVRILVVGDSTASATGEGLVTWADQRPELAGVTISWSVGCGFVQDGRRADADAEFEASCATVRADLPDLLADLQPDVLMLMQTIDDIGTRAFDDGRAPIQPGDDGFVEFLVGQYERYLVEVMSMGVGRIAWVIPPPPTDPVPGDPTVPAAALRFAVEMVAARHPEVVTVVDLDAWQQSQAADLRPDGLHYSPDAAAMLAETLLGPALVAAALS